jgi:cysteinyl-tRNA synthetase
MAVKYLGPRIDIHGGGSDLVFPHHTCEIAQSENATSQRPFVKIWMHCGMTRLDGEKMSKSLGNLILVRNLLPTYTPDAVRLLLLSHHYRESWEYTEDEMRAVQALADRLTAAARSGCEGAGAGEDDAASRQSRLEFIAALEDDFHTETSVGVLVRLAERARTETTGAAAAMLRELATVVGLRLCEGAPATTEPALGVAEV